MNTKACDLIVTRTLTCHMIDMVYNLIRELFTYCVPGGLLLNDAALDAMVEDCAGDGITDSVRDFVLDCDL